MSESRADGQFVLGALTLAATAFAAFAAWKSYEVAERTQLHQELLEQQRERPLVVFRQNVLDLPFDQPLLPVVNIGEVPVTDLRAEWSGITPIVHTKEESGIIRRVVLTVYLPNEIQELKPSVLKRDEAGNAEKLPGFCDRLAKGRSEERIEGVLRLHYKAGREGTAHQTAYAFTFEAINGGVRLTLGEPRPVDWSVDNPLFRRRRTT